MKKETDITIHTWKGVAFILFIIIAITFSIVYNIMLYKDYQKEKAFWGEIEENGLGRCNKLTFFVSDCSLEYYIENETDICNLLLKYSRKELIKRGDFCNFEVK